MNPLLRAVDAGLNRAREGLRTLEDLARFVAGDAAVCEKLKTLRHEVTATAGTLPADQAMLAAWRDTHGDVGKTISTPSEMTRASARDIAVASGGRSSEALRSLEEFSKAFGEAGTAASAAFERIRYALYEQQQRLLAMLPIGTAPQWRLCVILTEALCTHKPWHEVATLAMDGGADCIQLREKTATTRHFLHMARDLVRLARPRGVGVIINDRPDIAVLSAADGVHLGQTDLAVADVRKLAGSSLLIGVSTASVEQADRALEQGADYVGVGPMFESTTKHRPVISGPEFLCAFLAHSKAARLPHLAIGGITAKNVHTIGALGCRGIAVSAAVCSAEDPKGTCESLLQGLGD